MICLKNTLFAFFLVFVFANTFGQTADVRVVVQNIAGTEGLLTIGIFNNSSDFKTKTNPVRGTETEIAESTVSYKFSNVPAGNYAIAVFHDANGDGKLNAKSMKIPAEGVGVSGKKMGKLRLPKFEEAVFGLQYDTLIVIKMVYPGSK